MYQKWGKRIQKMREEGRQPPVGTKLNRKKGKLRSNKVRHIDDQAQTSQLNQWADYVRECHSMKKPPQGVPAKIMRELEQRGLI